MKEILFVYMNNKYKYDLSSESINTINDAILKYAKLINKEIKDLLFYLKEERYL